MFVTKKKYNELLNKLNKQDAIMQECRMWKAKYNALNDDKATLTDGVVVAPREAFLRMVEPNNRMVNELEKTKDELEKYKQLYADEVQKRLALIEQLGK